MKIIKELKLADLITIGNFCAGILSVFFSIKQELNIAASLMILAFVLDFLDGRVARYMKSDNKFGKELDSLGDLVSFGVAPAVFGYSTGLSEPIHMIILIFFAVCGMIRLARFNVLKIKGFIGVPITTNGIIFPLIYFIVPFSEYVILIYLIMSVLMISDIKIKKI